MIPEVARSIELVQDGQSKPLGTCFCVATGKGVAYYVSCVHVVRKIQSESPLRKELKGLDVWVGDRQGVVVFSGDDRLDLVVVEVRDPEKEPLALTLVKGLPEGFTFRAHGYQSRRTPSVKQIIGTLSYRSWEGSSAKYPRLVLSGDKNFVHGMSGGPVLDDRGRAMGMMTQKDEAQEGSALEIGEILAHEMPGLAIKLEHFQDSNRTPIPASLINLPSLLPYQADRILPKDRLHQFLDERNGPLVMARVHGPESAEHDMFLHVFGFEYLSLQETNRFNLAWHAYLNGYHHELFEAVMGQQCEIGGGKSPKLADIVHNLPEGDALILVDGSAEEVCEPYLSSLKQWLMEWRRLDLEPNRRIVIGVALRFHDEVGTLAQRLQIKLRNWILRVRVAQTLGRIKDVRDVGSLDVVTRGTMNRWIKLGEKWLSREFLDYQEGDLRFRVDQVFEARGKAIPMRTLAAELRTLLENYRETLTPKHR